MESTVCTSIVGSTQYFSLRSLYGFFNKTVECLRSVIEPLISTVAIGVKVASRCFTLKTIEKLNLWISNKANKDFKITSIYNVTMEVISPKKCL